MIDNPDGVPGSLAIASDDSITKRLINSQLMDERTGLCLIGSEFETVDKLVASCQFKRRRFARQSRQFSHQVDRFTARDLDIARQTFELRCSDVGCW